MTDKELKSDLLLKLQLMKRPRWLDKVDVRICEYIKDVQKNSEGEKDVHNVDEVAACVKFLRMCSAYEFDAKHVQRFIRMYENFYFSGLKGRTKYRMTPIQVFLTAGIFGFVNEGRRVVREAIVFIPRKFAKTTYLAALSMDDFLFGDSNGEVHIVANAHDQAKIAYREAKSLAMQLDPEGKQIRFTADTFNWRDGERKQSMVQAHTAGGKTKDGAFASLVLADEYGSASYVKDHCDMADALNVYESSMGPRLNPLTVITTTAGKVIEGPFERKLINAQDSLYKELEAEEGKPMETDWQFLLALHPDKWEYTDEYLCQERVHKKVNPHIGITVQPDYYRNQWKKAQGDPEVYKEVVTKLFNKFVSNSSKPWIQAEDIRALQCDHRVDDLDPKEWRCFVGADFSHGDDLHTLSYHCVNIKTKQYFWDCDVWIAEEQLHSNTNAALYEHFIEAGYMRTSESKVIPSSLLVERLEEVNKHAPIIRFGYDAYDATDNLNDIRTWFVLKLRQKGKSNKQIEDILKEMIVPVSQTWASYNAPTTIAWKLVNDRPQKLYISRSEVLPWTFGCAILDIDKNDNAKPIKRSANAKVDPVQALISGIKMEMELRS